MEFLANWLVQGSIVVAAAAALLRSLHRARAHARYWVCTVGFALVLALPLMSTLSAFVSQEDASSAIDAAPLPLVSLPHTPSSNTFLIVQAGRPVPWTKPDLLPHVPDRPLPKLGGFGGGQDFYAAFADGSVRLIKKSTAEKVLRALITHAGGEAVSPPD